MKITLKVLLEAEQALTKTFSIGSKDSKLDAKAIYALSKIAKKVQSELRDIYETRQMLWEKYGEKDEKGQLKQERMRIVFKDPKGFEKEWKDFIETEIDLDVWMIPFETLLEADLTPLEIASMDMFIKDEPEEIINLKEGKLK